MRPSLARTLAVPRPEVGARRRSAVGRALAYLILLGGAAVMLIPLYWMLVTSLKTFREANAYPPTWFPNPIVWGNYPEALAAFPFWRYLWNTLVIVLGVMLGNLVSCSLVAYAFAKLRAPGRNLLFGLLLATLMLPEHVTLVPLFVLFQRLGWINTALPLIVPYWFARSAFSVFLLRQFFLTIPQELSDAARVDGASHLTILTRILLPLSAPALATVAVFTFIGVWNDFLHPVIYLSKRETFTLALGLLALAGHVQEAGVIEWQLLMAGSTVVILPVLVVFFVAQRYFIEGIAMTGLKG
jgi:ABC-type glycerol-3-phosphate transport system permease component